MGAASQHCILQNVQGDTAAVRSRDRPCDNGENIIFLSQLIFSALATSMWQLVCTIKMLITPGASTWWQTAWWHQTRDEAPEGACFLWRAPRVTVPDGGYPYCHGNKKRYRTGTDQSRIRRPNAVFKIYIETTNFAERRVRGTRLILLHSTLGEER